VTRPGDDRDLIEHDGEVLDEHGIGQVGRRGHILDAAAESREASPIRLVLPRGEIDIDPHARQVRPGAVVDRRADGPGQGNLHWCRSGTGPINPVSVPSVSLW
jgi:hypothetical protein